MKADFKDEFSQNVKQIQGFLNMKNKGTYGENPLKQTGELDEATTRQLQVFLNQQMEAAKNGDKDARKFWREYGPVLEAAGHLKIKKNTAIQESLKGFSKAKQQDEKAKAAREAELS